jgi:hypothetical protein
MDELKILNAILREYDQRRQANLKYSSEVRPGNIIPIELDLGTAQREIQLPSPFRAIWVGDATDSETNIKLMLHTNTEGARRNAYTMRQPTALNFNRDVAQAWIYWDAQTYLSPEDSSTTSKTMTLWVATDANIDLGRNITVNPSTGLAIGSLMDGYFLRTGNPITGVSVTINANTPFSIFQAPTEWTQNVTSIQNIHATEVVYIGDATVGTWAQSIAGTAPAGIALQPGEKFVLRNKAEIYGVVGTNVTTDLLAIMSEWS